MLVSNFPFLTLEIHIHFQCCNHDLLLQISPWRFYLGWDNVTCMSSHYFQSSHFSISPCKEDVPELEALCYTTSCWNKCIILKTRGPRLGFATVLVLEWDRSLHHLAFTVQTKHKANLHPYILQWFLVMTPMGENRTSLSMSSLWIS